MKNKLSIVIPCYNAEKYIRKCLDSLLVAVAKVDRECCEIVVVNDESTDGTLDVLQQYGTNIKILTTENQGVSAARNHGLANINGGGIWFVDADDEVDEHCLQFIFKSLQQNPADAIVFDFEYVKGENKKETVRRNLADDKKFRVLKDDAVFTEAITPLFGLSQMNVDRFFEGESPYVSDFLCRGYVWHYILKYSVLQENNLFFRADMKFGEDAMLFLRYLCYAKEINVINEKLYYYYERTSGALERIKANPKLLFESKMQLAEERTSINELCIKQFGKDMSRCYDGSLLFSALELCIKLSREKYRGNINLFRHYASYAPVSEAIKRIELVKAPLKYKLPIKLLQLNYLRLLYSLMYIAQRIGCKINV